VGHEEHRRGAPIALPVALLTISDTRSAADDASGDLARDLLEGAGHRIVLRGLLRDEPDAVAEWVRGALAREDCRLVVTSGGTGISPRDRTYEALAGLLERRLDGFGELFRFLSYQEIGSAAMLSRAIGGIAQGRILFCLPGSPGAVELALARLILPELGHLAAELRKA
jgi:molybdenum cofactor biosynthesis protein B